MRLKWRQLCFGPGVTRLDHLVRVIGLVKTQLLLLANADVYMAFYAMLGSKAGGVRAPACQPRTFSQDPGRALEVSALLKGLSNQYVIHLLESAVTLVLQRLLSQLLQRTEQNGEPHCAQRGKQGYGPQAIDPATEASDSITVFCFVWNSAMQWCCSSRTKCVPVALIALPCGLSFTSHCHCRLQNALYNEPYMRCNPPAGVEKRCPEDCLVNNLSVPYQLSSDQAGTGGYLGPDQCMVSQNKAHKFCFQRDGNIVMYNEANKPTWSSNTADASGGMASALDIQSNGRLFAWNGTQDSDWYWESSNPSDDREGPFDGILRNDGNFVIIRRSDKKVLWSTSPGE